MSLLALARMKKREEEKNRDIIDREALVLSRLRTEYDRKKDWERKYLSWNEWLKIDQV